MIPPKRSLWDRLLVAVGVWPRPYLYVWSPGPTWTDDPALAGKLDVGPQNVITLDGADVSRFPVRSLRTGPNGYLAVAAHDGKGGLLQIAHKNGVWDIVTAYIYGDVSFEVDERRITAPPQPPSKYLSPIPGTWLDVIVVAGDDRSGYTVRRALYTFPGEQWIFQPDYPDPIVVRLKAPDCPPLGVGEIAQVLFAPSQKAWVIRSFGRKQEPTC